LDTQARQIEASVHQQMELASLTSSITEFCQRVSHGLQEVTFEQKRQLVELLIDRVVVTMEEVEIRYVIPTSPTSEQIRFCHLLTDYSVSKSAMSQFNYHIYTESVPEPGFGAFTRYSQ